MSDTDVLAPSEPTHDRTAYDYDLLVIGVRPGRPEGRHRGGQARSSGSRSSSAAT